MKLIFNLSIFLLFPLLGISQSQTSYTKDIDDLEYQCIYTYTFQIDSTNANDVGKEDMLLLIGKKCSRFISNKKYQCDSLVYDFDRRGVPPEIALADISIFPKPKFTYQIFKNLPEGKISLYDRLFGDRYKYEQQMNFLQWEIESEMDSIAGMPCQKARTTYGGRDYEAWFTNEIPINDGPYKFHGLPGLIVKVGDTKNQHVFMLQAVKKVDGDKRIYFPTQEYIATTYEGLLKARKEASANVMERLQLMGAMISDPQKRKELSDRAKRNAKRKNNPLELK